MSERVGRRLYDDDFGGRGYNRLSQSLGGSRSFATDNHWGRRESSHSRCRSSRNHHHSFYRTHSPTRKTSHKYGGRLIIEEKLFSLSDNEFVIKEGRSLNRKYSVREDVFSVHGTRIMRDNFGRATLRMKKVRLSLRRTRQIEDARNDRVIVTLRRKSFLPMELGGSETLQVWKSYNDHGIPWLEIRGGFHSRIFFILDGVFGEDVAFVRRKLFTMKYLLFGKCTYVLTRLKDVDPALMSFLVIAIHDLF